MQNPILVIGAFLSALAAALHVAIIVAGARWYRFFGAGQRMVRAVEKGRVYPTFVTLGIVAVLAMFSAYALSGAHLIEALPWLKPMLCLITAIYLMRAMVLPALLIFAFPRVTRFWIWSSLICGGYGLAYLVGTFTAWPSL